MGTLTENGTGFLTKRVLHHGQCSFRPLICVPPRLLDPKFMAVLRRLTAHIDKVAILAYISSTMLDAVIFFIMHDVESQQVFIGKDFGAFFEVTAKNTNNKKFRDIQVYSDPM